MSEKRKRIETVELRDTESESGCILRCYSFGIVVDVRKDVLIPDGKYPDTWSYARLDYIDLPQLGKFINALTKQYNDRIDSMNEQAEKSVPLKTATKLRSLKTDAA